jgi:inhibitor of cysteine peptidase
VKNVVEIEVRKKTRVYGTVAFLSAITLVALIFVFGAAPVIFNPNASPIRTFSSYDELKSFLTANTQGSGSYYYGGPLDSRLSKFGEMLPIPAPAQATLGGYGAENRYSTTNIQVAGVDEADVVKTDGNYLYVIANNTVYIINANPQNAQLLAKIAFDNTYLAGIFLSQDSNRLVVFGSQYSVYLYGGSEDTYIATSRYGYFSDDVQTFINVYDISDKANPVLARNFAMSGSYFNSRMIGNYVYAVISQPAYLVNETVILPRVCSEAKPTYVVDATEIYYSDTVNYNNYAGFTTFIGLNIADDAQEPANMTLMTGGASNMYVSLSDIYVTYPASDGGTSVYRVHINESTINCEAQGKVPGYIINQYAMDEYNGYFRVATNAYDYNSDSGTSAQQNNVYVLDMNLTIVGKLENLATGENLHSVRFMGDKCYLVTFKNTDPLFVIDLSQPTAPVKLGELHIPGYSDYLHPYDENTLIGVGKETVESDTSDFAWYQGLKLSLFDVSNVNEPRQLSKTVIGDRGTDSPVLDDPKAFLFDKSRNLLVIPVQLYVINKTEPVEKWAYGQFAWQGVYVFDVTLTGGFVVRGNVTQMDNAEALLANPSLAMKSDYQWVNYDQWINRALYIGNTLYTVSNARVQLNSLDNFALIAKIDLN